MHPGDSGVDATEHWDAFWATFDSLQSLADNSIREFAAWKMETAEEYEDRVCMHLTSDGLRRASDPIAIVLHDGLIAEVTAGTKVHAKWALVFMHADGWTWACDVRDKSKDIAAAVQVVVHKRMHHAVERCGQCQRTISSGKVVCTACGKAKCSLCLTRAVQLAGDTSCDIKVSP